MKKEMKFDNAIDFDPTKLLEKANEANVSVDDYITEAKKAYKKKGRKALKKIRKEKDLDLMVDLIDKYNFAYDSWINYDHFEFEMKLDQFKSELLTP